MTKLYILTELGNNKEISEPDEKRLRYYTSLKALVEHENALGRCKMPSLPTLYRWKSDEREFYMAGNFMIYQDFAKGTGDL